MPPSKRQRGENAVQEAGPPASSTPKSPAQEVYGILEIRRRILKELDRRTLAVMLRTEKAITASVAEVLYRKIHISLVSKMSKASARRTVYCQAVRILDASPRPVFEATAVKHRSLNASPSPVRFDPEKVFKQLSGWRKKYPQLLRVDYHHPPSDGDDAYTAHLRDGTIHIDLERRETCPISFESPVIYPIDNLLPTLPSHPQLVINRTIAIRLVCDMVPDTPEKITAWRRELAKVTDHPRVVSVILSPLHGRHHLERSEAIALACKRKSSSSYPITSYQFPPGLPETFAELAEAIGPSLRTLYIHDSNLTSLGPLPDAIAFLDRTFPSLQSLSIQFSDRGGFRYEPSGLPNLTRLYYHCDRDNFSYREAAFLVHQLGNGDTVFLNPGLADSKEMKMFHAKVKQLKQ